jgi:hypothetical protein
MLYRGTLFRGFTVLKIEFFSWQFVAVRLIDIVTLQASVILNTHADQIQYLHVAVDSHTMVEQWLSLLSGQQKQIGLPFTSIIHSWRCVLQLLNEVSCVTKLQAFIDFILPPCAPILDQNFVLWTISLILDIKEPFFFILFMSYGVYDKIWRYKMF